MSVSNKLANGKWVVVLIFAMAISPRLFLGYFNREANDNHVDVVKLIVANQKLPHKADCWSCYQPKFYYVLCSAIVEALKISGFYQRIRVMQLVNVFFSFFILLLLWKFIDKQKLKQLQKYLVFALFAFNPCLTSINVQGTNDTPVILFGVLAVYACEDFFNELRPVPAIVMIFALIAAMLTKASGIILAGVIAMALLIKLLTESLKVNRVKAAKYFLILVIATVAIVPFAGGYYLNYKDYGSLTLSTWEKDPAPEFFEKT